MKRTWTVGAALFALVFQLALPAFHGHGLDGSCGCTASAHPSGHLHIQEDARTLDGSDCACCVPRGPVEEPRHPPKNRSVDGETAVVASDCLVCSLLSQTRHRIAATPLPTLLPDFDADGAVLALECEDALIQRLRSPASPRAPPLV